MANKKSIGLPGGPNEYITDISEYLSVEGYKFNSPDVNNPFNIIESGSISMQDVDFPVLGMDNLGNQEMMQPGMNYEFPGDQVFELPMAGVGGAIATILKKLPAIQKAVGKNLDDAVEYFGKNMDEFKDYIAKFSNDSKTILPNAAVTDVKTPLKLTFNQRGQIIPQQHMTSGKYSSNSDEALDHIYGDGPMWFAPVGDSRYINTSMNSDFVSGLGKTTQKSFTDFTGNTGKKGFDEFPLTETEKLTKDFGGYHPKLVDGKFVPDLDNPIMRSEGRFETGMQNKIEGIFNPDINIKTIDGKPSRLGHSMEGNWDNTKIGQWQDEGYDVVQVINEFTGDQLENILLPNSKHKFKVTNIDDMPVQIVNPEFKKGGGYLPEEQFGGSYLNTAYKLITDDDYKWTDALYDNTLAPLSNAIDVLSIPGALIGEAGEYFGERGDKEFNITDAIPGFKGDFSFKNMNDAQMKTLSGTTDAEGKPLVENAWGATALDIFTDPSTYVGAGLLKAGAKKLITKAAPIFKNTAKSTDNIVKATADDMVEVLTSDGSKKLMKKSDAIRLNRIEDANINNKSFTKYEDGNWFSDEIQPFYLNNAKNTLKGGILDPKDPKRVMSAYLDPEYAKLFDVSTQGTSAARNLSGGKGNLPIKGEYVLPPALVKTMREGTSGAGYNTMIGNSESIMKNLDSFYRKLGGGDLPKAQFGLLKKAVPYLKNLFKRTGDFNFPQGSNSKIKFIDNVKDQQIKDAARIPNYLLFNDPNKPQLQNLVNHYTKQSNLNDGVTSVYRAGYERAQGKTGWYSSDLGDPLRYLDYKRGDGVFKADVPNEILKESYRGKVNNLPIGDRPPDYNNSLTSFKEFQLDEAIAEAFADRKFGKKTSAEYVDYLKTLKKYGGDLPEAQLGNLGKLLKPLIKTGKKYADDLFRSKPQKPQNFDDLINLPDEEFAKFTSAGKDHWKLVGKKGRPEFKDRLMKLYNGMFKPNDNVMPAIEKTQKEMASFFNTPEYKQRLINGLNISTKEADDIVRDMTKQINETKFTFNNSGSEKYQAQAASPLIKGGKANVVFTDIVNKYSPEQLDGIIRHELGHVGSYLKTGNNKLLSEQFPKLDLQERLHSTWSNNKNLIDYYSTPDEIRQRGLVALDFIKKNNTTIDNFLNISYDDIVRGQMQGKIPREVQDLVQYYKPEQLGPYLKKMFSVVGTLGLGDQLTQKKDGGPITPELLMKQAYVESNWDPSIVNSKGYTGLGQIGPDLVKDYRKANKIEGSIDLLDPKVNSAIQSWSMNELINSSFINKGDSTDEVKLAKALAAYNWGRGNMSDMLVKQKAAGVDIYKSLDWLDALPKETLDYYKMITTDDFNPEKRPLVQQDYLKALQNDSIIQNYYKKTGGESEMISVYKDYVNGKSNNKEGKKVYDKLNRIHLKDARSAGMAVPNYIMTYV